MIGHYRSGLAVIGFKEIHSSRLKYYFADSTPPTTGDPVPLQPDSP
jgi:hypothetical protein